MFLSRTEELKTKLAGGAAAIAIEAAFIAAIVFGLTASYVAREPEAIQLVPVPAQRITPPEPPQTKPLQNIFPDLVAPLIEVDRPRPPDLRPVVQPTEFKPLAPTPEPIAILPEPPPLPPARTEPVRKSAGFDGRYRDVLQPDYPSAARRLDMEGRVELRVLIGTDGRVKQAEVRKSSGHSVLDEAAIAHALKKWRYKPATEDGTPVESWTSVPVTFELKQA